MSEPAPHLIVEREGPILIATFNRPERRNALCAEMLARMYDAWVLLDEDPELRVGILTGAGGTFCSGADLKAMAGGGADDSAGRASEDADLHWKALLRHYRPRSRSSPPSRARDRRRHRDPPGHRHPRRGRAGARSASPRCAGPLPARRLDGAAAPADPLHASRPSCCSPAGTLGRGGPARSASSAASCPTARRSRRPRRSPIRSPRTARSRCRPSCARCARPRA